MRHDFYFLSVLLSSSEHSHCHSKDKDENLPDNKILAEASAGAAITETAVTIITRIIVARVTIVEIVKI